MNQRESADEFLERLDSEKVEQVKEEQKRHERERQHMQQLLSWWTPIIEEHLDALGKKWLGGGKYEVKYHAGDIAARFWVEELIWHKGVKTVRVGGYDGDRESYDIQYKRGFSIHLMYNSKDECVHLNSKALTEEALKECIANAYRGGPAEHIDER